MRENEQKYSPRWCLVGNIVKTMYLESKKKCFLAQNSFNRGPECSLRHSSGVMAVKK